MSGDKKEADSDKMKSFSGIPEAVFVENVDEFMSQPENGTADIVLKRFDEQYRKYKFMEINFDAKRRRLRNLIPDMEHSLKMVIMLESKQNTTEEIETQFLLADQVYLKASVPPTNQVCLWLGANVMLEYTLEDAKALLQKNLDTAQKNLSQYEHDLDFLRYQFTTTEVNLARVYNWEIKRRQSAEPST